MSEKVLLGFWKKGTEPLKDKMGNIVGYKVNKQNLVPVSLKNESILFEELQKEIKEMAEEAEIHTRHLYSKEGYLLALNNLLAAIRAKKQASEK
jgi:hypothetical protein